MQASASGEIFSVIEDVRGKGVTMLLIEQNTSCALSVATKGDALEFGCVFLSGSGNELLSDDRVRQACLGN